MNEFASYAGGAVADAAAMSAAIAGAAGVIHAWPVRYAHPVDAMNRPVVRMAGSTAPTVVRDARLAMTGKLSPPAVSGPVITAEMIQSLLR
jgi:hypothetical protein